MMSESRLIAICQEIERASDGMYALIIELLRNMENLRDVMNNVRNIIIAQSSSTISNGSESHSQHVRGLKRCSDEPVENESPTKTSKADDECGSLMNINSNMNKDEIIETLNEWLVQVYNQTAKIYYIKKCSHIGIFHLYVAIDVHLDESKDDIHVVINSDQLHRPDDIFQFIENCFHGRKVVTLLHIKTNDSHQLRENLETVADVIKSMMEPILAHL